MKTLFIDTHMSLITIILFIDGKIIDKKEVMSNQKHSVFTMPLIKKILEQNNINIQQINQIIVVNGPGSFTGVRIGVTIAKMLAYTLNVPIKMINSLEVLAVNIKEKNKIVVVSDKNGKFVGKFQDNNQIEDLKYIKNSDFDEENYYENVEIDYEKVYEFLMSREAVNPHEANPIYVKDIEVLK